MTEKVTPVVILLAGYSAAGKTTLGNQLQEEMGYKFIPHQPLIHSLAEQKGYARVRYWLEDVGQDEFVKETTKEMLQRVSESISSGDNKLVIDVAYGKEMLNNIKNEFPGISLIVTAIYVSEESRLERIAKRMGGATRDEAVKELAFRDKFLIDVGLQQVLMAADLEIENTKEPAEIARELEAKISEKMNR